MKRGEKGYWLNTEKRIWQDIVKPCKLCGFCPYGQLVEEFPLYPYRPEGADLNELAREGKLDTKYSCQVLDMTVQCFITQNRYMKIMI